MHKSACMDGHALIGGYLFADATMYYTQFPTWYPGGNAVIVHALLRSVRINQQSKSSVDRRLISESVRRMLFRIRRRLNINESILMYGIVS